MTAMIIDYATHYNEEYWTRKKAFRTQDGRVHRYEGPSLQWEGFQDIAISLSRVLSPKQHKTLLDVGCSGGDLIRYLQEVGFDPWGVDISKYALDNSVAAMRSRLGHADVSTTPEQLHSYFHLGETLPQLYDVVIATDLLEHFYEEDIDRVLDWMIGRARHYLFFCVAVIDGAPTKREFVHQKGTPVPQEWELTAVSGHVNVRHWRYWAKKFQEHGLVIDWARMYLFQMERERVPGWKATGGWNLPTTWILRKPQPQLPEPATPV